jgi:hypothetical protein
MTISFSGKAFEPKAIATKSMYFAKQLALRIAENKDLRV